MNDGGVAALLSLSPFSPTPETVGAVQASEKNGERAMEESVQDSVFYRMWEKRRQIDALLRDAQRAESTMVAEMFAKLMDTLQVLLEAATRLLEESEPAALPPPLRTSADTYRRALTNVRCLDVLRDECERQIKILEPDAPWLIERLAMDPAPRARADAAVKRLKQLRLCNKVVAERRKKAETETRKAVRAFLEAVLADEDALTPTGVLADIRCEFNQKKNAAIAVRVEAAKVQLERLAKMEQMAAEMRAFYARLAATEVCGE